MELRIRAKSDPMVLKQLFFKKLRKIAQQHGALSPDPHNLRRLGGLHPQTTVNNTFELQYTSFLNTSFNLDIFTF